MIITSILVSKHLGVAKGERKLKEFIYAVSN